MALEKETINLLRRIEEQILEEPKRLEMDGWGCAFSPTAKGKNVPPCRTHGCIAGWAILLKEPRTWKKLLKASDTKEGSYAELEDSTSVDPSIKGQQLLGIDDTQAERLFYVPSSSYIENADSYQLVLANRWPLKFAKAYRDAKGPAGRARATVNRIEHFIKTDGAE